MPTLPKEHGAWVMLSVSLVLGAWAGRAPWVLALLLLLATLAAFCAQNVARLWIRKRARRQDFVGLIGFCAVGLGTLAPVAWAMPRLLDLLTLAVLAALLFGVQGVLLVIPAKKRLDRSLWGELAAVPALTLPAPAAAALASPLGPAAWRVWGLCIVFFASGFFAVKLVLASARFRQGLTPQERWAIGGPHVIYHLFLVVLLVVLRSPWLWAAFGPALVRAALTYLRIDGTLPPLKKVGMREAALAVWFASFVSVTF